MPKTAEEFCAEGEVLAIAANFNGALELYNQAIVLKPDYVEAYLGKAYMLVKSQKYPEALECCNKVIELKPDSSMGYARKGNCLEHLDRDNEAIEAWDKAISLDPKNFLPYTLRASLEQAYKRYDKALEWHNKAVSVDPNSAMCAYNRACCFIVQDKYQEALPDYNSAVTLNPNNALYYCERGKCLNKLGKEKEAMEDFTKAVELVQSGKLGNTISLRHLALINDTLKPIIELQTIAKQTEENLKGLDRNNSDVKKLIDNLQNLEDAKNKATNNVLSGLDKKEIEAKDKLEIQRITEEFKKKLAELKIFAIKKHESKAKTAEEFFAEAEALVATNFIDALELYSQAIVLKPDYVEAYLGKAYMLVKSQKYPEALECCNKVIELKPDSSMGYARKGNCLEHLNRDNEAIEAWDKAISLDPKNFLPYTLRASLEQAYKRYDTALEWHNKAVSVDPNSAMCAYNRACCFIVQDKYQEALPDYNSAVTLNPNNALYYCERGKCLNKLGKEKEAMEDFTKAVELVQSGKLGNTISMRHLTLITETLVPIINLQNIAKQTEEKLNQLDKSNVAVQKFVDNVKSLQEAKNKATNTILNNLDKKEMQTNEKAEIQKITEAFQKQLDELKALTAQKIEKLQNQVDQQGQDIEKLQIGFESIMEELNTKMDDFNKKLEQKLAAQDVSLEDKTKLKEYFGAFIGTFSSVYVTSQVIDSGQVQIDSDSSAATILSTIASFTPFIGDILSTGIKSIGDFLKGREMKEHAKTMKLLANDSTELSQIVGKAAYEIVLNPQKQQTILKVTDKDLEKSRADLYGKIAKFCSKLEQKVTALLYGKLYRSPASSLGHNDANQLIEEWIKGTITPYDISQQFQKVILQCEGENGQIQESTLKDDGKSVRRTHCCNMF